MRYYLGSWVLLPGAHSNESGDLHDALDFVEIAQLVLQRSANVERHKLGGGVSLRHAN